MRWTNVPWPGELGLAASPWSRANALTSGSPSTATASATQISRMRASASRPSRSTSTPIDTPSTEARLTTSGEGRDPPPARARPRWRAAGSSSCTARRVLVAVAGRRCRGTGRRPAGGRSRRAHTTAPRRAGAPAVDLRSSARLVAPARRVVGTCHGPETADGPVARATGPLDRAVRWGGGTVTRWRP